MHCPNCGNPIEDGALFCGSCGQKLAAYQGQDSFDSTPPSSAPRAKHPGRSSQKRFSRAIALILVALLLVALGAVALAVYTGRIELPDLELPKLKLPENWSIQLPWKDKEDIPDIEEGQGEMELFTSSEQEIDAPIPIAEPADEKPMDTTPNAGPEDVTTGSETKGNPVIRKPYSQQELQVKVQGSTAELALLEWQEDGSWKTLFSTDGFIGENGLAEEKEDSDGCTPAGSFQMLYCLSVEELDTPMDNILVSGVDVWVCDPQSIYYNTLQPDFAWADWAPELAEDIYARFTSGDSVSCILFDYNGDGIHPNTSTAGAGSGIFLDGVGSEDRLRPSKGDIRISGEDMLTLLSYLDSALNPTIIIY